MIPVSRSAVLAEKNRDAVPVVPLTLKPVDPSYLTFDIACGIASQLAQEIWEYFHRFHYDRLEIRYPRRAQLLLCNLSRLNREWRKASMPYVVRSLAIVADEDDRMASTVNALIFTVPAWPRWIRFALLDLKGYDRPLTTDAIYGALVCKLPQLQSIEITMDSESFELNGQCLFPETRISVLALKGLTELCLCDELPNRAGVNLRREIIAAHANSLRSLCLHGCRLDGPAITVIMEASKLRALAIHSCITSGSPRRNNLPMRLTTLVIRLPKSNLTSMKAIFALWLRLSASTLEHLSFRGPPEYFDNAPPVPSVRTLSLDFTDLIEFFTWNQLPVIIRLCESGLVKTLRLPGSMGSHNTFVTRLSNSSKLGKITRNLEIVRVPSSKCNESIISLASVCVKNEIGLEYPEDYDSSDDGFDSEDEFGSDGVFDDSDEGLDSDMSGLNDGGGSDDLEEDDEEDSDEIDEDTDDDDGEESG